MRSDTVKKGFQRAPHRGFAAQVKNSAGEGAWGSEEAFRAICPPMAPSMDEPWDIAGASGKVISHLGLPVSRDVLRNMHASLERSRRGSI